MKKIKTKQKQKKKIPTFEFKYVFEMNMNKISFKKEIIFVTKINKIKLNMTIETKQIFLCCSILSIILFSCCYVTIY